MKRDGAERRRELLLFHPAGVFFVLSTAAAALLPWLWALSLRDPLQAHVRLGIFGFGGVAVLGYLLTAQRAWTGLDAPLPALVLVALAAAARIIALLCPEAIWPVCVPLILIALAILLPVLQARRWDRLLLALTPFALIGTEVAFIRQQVAATFLPIVMAVLILAVGGRMVPAFLAEEQRRRGFLNRTTVAVWPVLGLAGLGLALNDMAALLALGSTALWVLYQAGKGIDAWPANRILSIGYAMLAPGLLSIPATRMGLLPQMVQIHLLTMGAMGSMIAAVACRVSMRRIEGIGLKPLARHWIVLWLILAATVTRCLAEFVPMREAIMVASGITWSAAWLLFLSVQLTALVHPAPFPLLSAERARLKPA